MMFSDFLLTEGIEPKKPIGTIRTKKVVKNRGMINQRILHQIEFNTTSGNNVKVQFEIQDDVGDVVFYVNDTLDDLGGRKDGSVDPEILSGVLWIVDVYSDKMKLNGLTFKAWQGKGDTKIVKGMSLDNPLKMAKSLIIDYMEKVKVYNPVIIPPSPIRIALAAKLGRSPINVYDVDVGKILEILGKILDKIEKNDIMVIGDIREFEEYLWRRVDGKSLEDKIPGAKKLMDILNQYKTARLSHEESGATVTRNRRQNLYKRLVDKFFSEKWNIKQDGNKFELTRKGVTENVTVNVVNESREKNRKLSKVTEGIVKIPKQKLYDWFKNHEDEIIAKIREAYKKGYETYVDDSISLSGEHGETIDLGLVFRKKLSMLSDDVSIDPLLFYDKASQSIYVNASLVLSKYKTKKSIIDGLLEGIVHEITHVMDLGRNKKKNKYSSYDEYINNPVEFPAFVNMYIHRIESAIKSGNMTVDKVLDGLRGKKPFPDREINKFMNRLTNDNLKKFIKYVYTSIRSMNHKSFPRDK